MATLLTSLFIVCPRAGGGVFAGAAGASAVAAVIVVAGAAGGAGGAAGVAGAAGVGAGVIASVIAGVVAGVIAGVGAAGASASAVGVTICSKHTINPGLHLVWVWRTGYITVYGHTCHNLATTGIYCNVVAKLVPLLIII